MTTTGTTAAGEKITKTVSLTIDGVKVDVPQGTTVLEAAKKADIYIPTLCYDPDLKPYGGCRLCIVEIEKMRGMPTSCTTTATDGMVVHTETPAVNQARLMVMELIMANHNGDCLTCAKNQNCELQTVARYLGIEQEHFDRLRKSTETLPVDDSNPAYIRDMNKCILCARCVRACHEVTGIDAIDIAYRGNAATIAGLGNLPILLSRCETCGECVARCPTGALTFKESRQVTREVKTTCPYCGTGCQVYLGIRNGEIISVRGDKEGPANEGHLCVKGRFGVADFVHHKDRLKTPLIKRNGKFEEATWDEALDIVTRKLGRYHGDEVAIISSAKTTNEDNYVMQKFARTVLGTNNVDHCARLCHAPTVAGLATTFGSGAMTNNIDDFSNAKCILAIGTNAPEAHPVLAMKVRQVVRGGTKLIVANPMEIDFVRDADLWIQHKVGTDVALLMGMCRIIYDEGLYDKEFVEERCENFEAFCEELKNYPLDWVAKTTGVETDLIVKAARMYATNPPATILYTMGITQHTHGTDNVMAVADIAMLTGNVGKPGSGVNPLRGQNNVQGACDVGALPNVYTGYQQVADPKAREKFEAAWSVKLNPTPGKTLTEIMPLAHEGKIKAMYLMGENPSLSDPDSKHVREAMEKLEFFVVQDIFLTETGRYADVILPATTFAEKDGTFTNTERRVQRVRKAIEPVGESRPDWLITCEIARRMGAKGFDYKDPAAIMEEIARLTPSYAGINYRRLDEGGLQWPCPSDDHPGTCILHEAIFARPSGKGNFVAVKYRPSAESPDAQYPLLLTTNRSLFHFHTGTMTRKVKSLNILRKEELVAINPTDAAELGVSDGEMVRVTSRRGSITSKVMLTEASPRGTVAMTFHFAESPTNELTNPAFDPVSKIPEYKVSAVRIEPLGAEERQEKVTAPGRR
jgi:formate dehydrogenase alpha subunit